MKFLIFNIIVFFSLGYLLTSKPNENFNQWFGNTKNKISQISKNEIVSTIKKATSKNKKQENLKNVDNKKVNNIVKKEEVKEVVSDINAQENLKNLANKDSNEIEKKEEVKEVVSDINVQENPKKLSNKESNKVEKIEMDKDVVTNINKQENSKNLNNKKFDVQKIINEVLAAKKTNELNRKKIVENNSKIKTKSNEINKIEVKKVRQLREKNKFMSNIERENALAELIIDMELYHFNTLND